MAEDVKDEGKEEVINPSVGEADSSPQEGSQELRNEEQGARIEEQGARAEEQEQEPKQEPDPRDVKIAELEKKAADAEDQLLRSRAEFANYKRRTTEEALKLGTFTTCNVVKEFLKVLDNFERAEAQVEKLKAENSENDMLNAVVAGMEKIKKQFEETLKKLDVEEIKAQNEKFNPNLHEAVMRGENPDLEEDTIDQVFEKGYKIRESVIRTSKVRVITK